MIVLRVILGGVLGLFVGAIIISGLVAAGVIAALGDKREVALAIAPFNGMLGMGIGASCARRRASPCRTIPTRSRSRSTPISTSSRRSGSIRRSGGRATGRRSQARSSSTTAPPAGCWSSGFPTAGTASSVSASRRSPTPRTDGPTGTRWISSACRANRKPQARTGGSARVAPPRARVGQRTERAAADEGRRPVESVRLLTDAQLG